MPAYLFVVMLRTQEIVDDGHPLSQLLTEGIQEAISVF